MGIALQPRQVARKRIRAIVFPGASGDYVSTPDAAQNSITSDITLIVYAKLDDWADGSAQSVIGKWVSTGNQESYVLQVAGNGTIGLVLNPTGANAAAVSTYSSVATGFKAHTGHWIRATWDDSANTVSFYTSDDHADTDPSAVTWTLLGTANRALASAGIFDSNSALEIGSIFGGTGQIIAGRVMRAVGIASTDPTAAASWDFDPSKWTTGTTFTSGGVVYTLNGNVFTHEERV